MVHNDRAEKYAPIIDRLYATFANCHLPSEMSFCTYCDTSDYERSIHQPLRSLPLELIDKYVWDAIHHTGDEQDYKHFVPRIFELLVESKGWPLADPEFVIGRLSMAQWMLWTPDERDAVNAVLSALWNEALSAEPWVEIDELVCGLTVAHDGVSPEVDGWISDPRPLATSRFVEFILANSRELPNGHFRDPWYGYETGTRMPTRRLVEWLSSEDVYTYLSTVDPSVEVRAADALVVLDQCRSWGDRPFWGAQ